MEDKILEFINNVDKARVEKKISIRELSRMSGITLSSTNRFLRSDSDKSLKVAFVFANILGLTIEVVEQKVIVEVIPKNPFIKKKSRRRKMGRTFELFVKAYNEGMTNNEIASALGLSIKYIINCRGLARKKGLIPPYAKKEPIFLKNGKEIIEMYKSGIKTSVIFEKFQIERNNVNKTNFYLFVKNADYQ